MAYGSKESDIYGCTDPIALNYDSTATFDNGSCEYNNDNPIVQVKLDATAEDGWVHDYNGRAYIGFYHLHEDGTAMIGEGTMGATHTIDPNQIILQTNTYDDTYDVYGCMDPEATNYDKLATVDNNSCTYTSEVYGCMDPEATNYDSRATVDDGTCTYTSEVYGCMDPEATNYDKLATVDDGTCTYIGTGNTVVSASLEALPGNWIKYTSPFEEYVGTYHLMRDGTAMIGEGVLGAEHVINPEDVITYVGSTSETGIFGYVNITNLNPSRGDVSVDGNLLSTYPDGWSFQIFLTEEVTITTTPLYGFLSYSPVWSGDLITPDNVNSTSFSIVMNDNVDITVDFELIDKVEFELTKSDVKERVADIFYKKFFQANVLTDAQVLAIQTTTRGGKKRTGRQEGEQLVFYKKDKNTIENRDDLQGESFNTIVDYIHANNLLTLSDDDDGIDLEDSFTLTFSDLYGGEIPGEAVDTHALPPGWTVGLMDYNIKYEASTNTDFTREITLATEVILVTSWGDQRPVIPPYFTDALNLSQIVKPKIGAKINPEKAREVLDTNIFELLPTQTTRQDQINDFFNEFNDLVGQAPPFDDADLDGAGESLTPLASGIDSGSRVSYENKSSAYITRLNTHANTNNQGKTLESMRNKLNTYLGDVDNVVQVIEDQRPEYENKSTGFLKIRKPNQAIILRNPNDELEFQKNNSYLIDGFTITMWVRFVGKTGTGTLFNFGNTLSIDSPYGFRLETITAEHPTTGLYQRAIRLGVRDHINNKFHDNSWGTLWQPRVDTSGRGGFGDGTRTTPNWGYTGEYITAPYPSVPTDDLNEWFFICATFNPNIKEDESLSDPLYKTPGTEYANLSDDDKLTTLFPGYRNNMWNYAGESNNSKLFWQNHYLPNDNGGGDFVANSNYGAKCKVEIISRSDLLRARGYKGPDSGLGLNVETD